jgi:hypothetical protein
MVICPGGAWCRDIGMFRVAVIVYRSADEAMAAIPGCGHATGMARACQSGAAS